MTENTTLAPSVKFEYMGLYERIVIIKWGTSNYIVGVQSNAFPDLKGSWKDLPLDDLQELNSPMELYGYIQAMGDKYHVAID